MDYEKKYNEAVCNIQKLLENGRKEGEVICAYEADFMSIFPELKESEEERMRKFLHHTFTVQYLAKDKLGKWHGEPVSNILAWLEKQGEKEHQYKSRPRYVGEEELLGANKQGEQILANIAKTCKDEQKPNPYSGTSFEYNGHTTFSSDCIDITETINWLKSIKYRVHPKQEWSEEVEAAITLLKDIAEEQEKDYCPHNANDLRKAAQYLETCRPQNTWKPSDEQIMALRWVLNHIPYDSHKEEISGLLEQLKKLRTE